MKFNFEILCSPLAAVTAGCIWLILDGSSGHTNSETHLAVQKDIEEHFEMNTWPSYKSKTVLMFSISVHNLAQSKFDSDQSLTLSAPLYIAMYVLFICI